MKRGQANSLTECNGSYERSDGGAAAKPKAQGAQHAGVERVQGVGGSSAAAPLNFLPHPRQRHVMGEVDLFGAMARVDVGGGQDVVEGVG